jgi:hypothetical protein
MELRQLDPPGMPTLDADQLTDHLAAQGASLKDELARPAARAQLSLGDRPLVHHGTPIGRAYCGLNGGS